jgi:hypothetical protein
MELWDADAHTPIICNQTDSHIGDYTIQVIPGQLQYNWSNGNASGYVEFDTVFGTAIVDTLKVTIEGRPAKPSLIADHDSVCNGDSIRLMVTPTYTNMQYEWWKDSTYIVGATDSFYYTQNSGKYYVKVTNLTTGCSQRMDTPAMTVAISPYFPTSSTIYYDGSSHQFFLNPFPNPGGTAVWYYNGQVVSGQSGRFLPWLGDGVYKADMYPTGFPACGFTTADFIQTGINDQTSEDLSDLSVFPNPNNGSFKVNVNILSTGTVMLKMTDMLGRDVYEKRYANQHGELHDNIHIADLAKNVYTLQIISPRGKATKRVVIE